MTSLNDIVKSKRLPVLFVGSGISKRYLYRYPDWDGILKIAYKKVNPDPFQFQKLKDSFVRRGMDNFEVNINMATAIEEQFNAAYYDRVFTIPGDKSKNPA